MLHFREDLRFLSSRDEDSWRVLLYLITCWVLGHGSHVVQEPQSLLKGFDQQTSSDVGNPWAWGSAHLQQRP